MPPGVFENLKFPKGIWKSISELAALADWRNKENKNRQYETRMQNESTNKDEECQDLDVEQDVDVSAR